MKIVIPEGKIGVGVSGGADSMVLLDLLRKSGAQVFAINIEHGIRGEESERDSRFVADFCMRNDIELMSFSVDAPAESRITKESLELTARRLRYGIFDALLEQKKADYIALAHHASDNAETILMRILRGTGTRGLRGIVDRGGYIHPLIKYSRKQIEHYAADCGIPYINDSTNLLNDYTRNFLRNMVFPTLEQKFTNIENSFLRLAENAAETEAYLQTQLLDIFEDGGSFYLDIEQLRKAHSLIAKYSINELLSRMGAVQDIESRHLEYIISLCGKQNNAVINLPFGIIAVKEYDRLAFRKDTAKEYFCSPFSLDTEYIFEGSCYRFEKTQNIAIGISFDANKIPEGAVMRTRQEGDIFKRCNGRTKKLSDFLTDIKLTADERDKLLVLAYEGEALAVCGMEISDKIKVDKYTKEIINIIKE
ncbi:MAG: tRNA lysidine(34) synthetase TilS [Clostridia bacterium]|nr:tRNA lysidine(34) synthetase TilS [Clostridia bacterium]